MFLVSRDNYDDNHHAEYVSIQLLMIWIEQKLLSLLRLKRPTLNELFDERQVSYTTLAYRDTYCKNCCIYSKIC